ncbi:MAG: GTPase HflX [Actinobacteria bacterium]|nr:GTPase HflX [Actinomycetota bacterium]
MNFELAYLIAVLPGPAPPDGADPLAELRELLLTAGAESVGEMIQRRDHPVAATYLGKGKLEELKAELQRLQPGLLVVEDELTPTQQRNLEDRLTVRVIDRTALILDIFAQHAHTAEGKLQVELAQLQFNLTRMRGKGTQLSRLGGGIGTRGPGETKLEVDQRVARKRIGTLKRRLKDLSSSREVMRRSRQASMLPLIALAGYTNTGKSTLLNAVAGSSVAVRNRLFETLDPATRAYEFERQTYLVTDTVGFIRKLPHQLVEAFHSTLEETLAAGVILVTAAADLPETELEDEINVVDTVLDDIGAGKIPRLLVLNKSDLLDAGQEAFLRRRWPDAVLISALAGGGLDELRRRIRDFFASRLEDVELFLPYGDAGLINEIYKVAASIELDSRPEGIAVRARIPCAQAGRFTRFRKRA